MVLAQPSVAARFLLIHSPLLTEDCWIPLASKLEAAGYEVAAVALNNRTTDLKKLYQHHLSLIDSALANLQDRQVVVVGHSGAGNLLAALDPEKISAFVFLDAIFPIVRSSRFALFDDQDAVQAWREIAERHQRQDQCQGEGVLPKHMLVRFGEQVKSRDARAALVANLSDAPIALYEELIPVHINWPVAKPGLFILWTASYTQDAARAASVRFEVRDELDVATSSHFKMLDKPNEVARLLLDFVDRKL